MTFYHVLSLIIAFCLFVLAMVFQHKLHQAEDSLFWEREENQTTRAHLIEASNLALSRKRQQDCLKEELDVAQRHSLDNAIEAEENAQEAKTLMKLNQSLAERVIEAEVTTANLHKELTRLHTRFNGLQHQTTTLGSVSAQHSKN